MNNIGVPYGTDWNLDKQHPKAPLEVRGAGFLRSKKTEGIYNYLLHLLREVAVKITCSAKTWLNRPRQCTLNPHRRGYFGGAEASNSCCA